MGVCVCNYSIYQDKNLTDLHPALICATDVMTGLVSQCLLSYLGYDLTSIHLRTSSDICTFSYSDIFNGQKVTALQALPTSNWCGNRVTLCH